MSEILNCEIIVVKRKLFEKQINLASKNNENILLALVFPLCIKKDAVATKKRLNKIITYKALIKSSFNILK